MFRRPATARDALPDELAGGLASLDVGSPGPVRFLGSYGKTDAFIARALTNDGARTSLALITFNRADHSGGFVTNSTQSFREGQWLTSVIPAEPGTSLRRSGAYTEVTIVVPDGYTDVTIPERLVRRSALKNNVLIAILRGKTSATFTGPHRSPLKVQLSISSPPGHTCPTIDAGACMPKKQHQ